SPGMIAKPLDPLTYTVSPLDRAGLLRSDDAAVRALLTGGKARIVPVWQQKHLVGGDGVAGIFSHNEMAHLLPGAEVCFLGLSGGHVVVRGGFAAERGAAAAGRLPRAQ